MRGLESVQNESPISEGGDFSKSQSSPLFLSKFNWKLINHYICILVHEFILVFNLFYMILLAKLMEFCKV